MNRPISRKRAFSLVELLTVIAIIGTLSAVLIGSIYKVRENANQAKCVSNVRQLGVSMLIYANENQGLAPAAFSTDWPEWIKKLYRGGYISDLSILVCPTDTYSGRTMVMIEDKINIDTHISYGANEGLIANWNANFAQINNAGNAARLAMVADCTAPVFDGTNADQRARITNSNDTTVWGANPTIDPSLKRHPGGNSVCFADGHASVVDQDTTQNGYQTGKFIYNPLQ